MFVDVAGLPLHPLIVHATVVFVPLSAVSAVCLVVVPRWRWALRWSTLVSAAVCLPTAWVSKLSGEALLTRQPELGPLVQLHQQRADQLVPMLAGYLLLAGLAFFALGVRTRPGGGRPRTGAAFPVQVVVGILLTGMAVWCLVQVVLTGDAGARAVWG